MARVRKFAFFYSYRDAMEGFDDASRLMFYEALMAYAFDGVEPDFDGDRALTVAWKLAKPNVDSSVNGQIHGPKGGRGNKAKGETPSETQGETPCETPLGTQGLTPSETPAGAPAPDGVKGGLEGGLKPPVPTDKDMDMDGDRRANASSIRPTYPPVQRQVPDGWRVNPAVKCGRCGSNIVTSPDGLQACPTCDPQAMLPSRRACSLCGSELDAAGWCPVCRELDEKAVRR